MIKAGEKQVERILGQAPPELQAAYRNFQRRHPHVRVLHVDYRNEGGCPCLDVQGENGASHLLSVRNYGRGYYFHQIVGKRGLVKERRMIQI